MKFPLEQRDLFFFFKFSWMRCLSKSVITQAALVIVLLIRHRFRHIAVNRKSSRETKVESNISLDCVDNLDSLKADICTKHCLIVSCPPSGTIWPKDRGIKALNDVLSPSAGKINSPQYVWTFDCACPCESVGCGLRRRCTCSHEADEKWKKELRLREPFSNTVFVGI